MQISKVWVLDRNGCLARQSTPEHVLVFGSRDAAKQYRRLMGAMDFRVRSLQLHEAASLKKLAIWHPTCPLQHGLAEFTDWPGNDTCRLDAIIDLVTQVERDIVNEMFCELDPTLQRE